ncbi:MAG: hypothetical protein ACOZAM_02620 [Pseudomonadota bacterium]
MKTNHRRSFKATRPSAKGGAFIQKRSAFADIAYHDWAGFEQRYDGNRGVARSIRGAKRYTNSCLRHREKATTRRLAYEQFESD